MHQAACNLQTPPHPARISLDQIMAPVFKVHQAQDFVNSGTTSRGIQTVKSPMKIQILFTSQFVVQTGILKDNADASPDSIFFLPDIVVANQCRAGCRRKHGGQYRDQSGLARAVGSQESEKLAPVDLEADVVESREVAELFC